MSDNLKEHNCEAKAEIRRRDEVTIGDWFSVRMGLTALAGKPRLVDKLKALQGGEPWFSSIRLSQKVGRNMCSMQQ